MTIEGLTGSKAIGPSVVELKDGKIRLYYQAWPTASRRTLASDAFHQIRSAVSEDGGKTFVAEEGIRFEASGISDPEVIHKPEGLWVMYLAHGKETLVVSSPDGLHFEDTGVMIPVGGVPGALLFKKKG